MHLKAPESAGGGAAEAGIAQQGPEKPYKHFTTISNILPFGQPISLSTISGPTYLTCQTLVQQVSFSLCDRLWTFSPDTFDLDTAAKSWAADGAKNSYGYTTKINCMQLRHGAGSSALGYTFSKDYDLRRRRIPQGIIASSAALPYLRTAFEQLCCFEKHPVPFVANIAAVDYMASSATLVTDYVSAQTLADEAGFALLTSFSAHEAQHVALLATLLSTYSPTVHVYDGVSVGRETTRVIDVLDQAELRRIYNAVLSEVSSDARDNDSIEIRCQQLFAAFNGELGTQYSPFETHGHVDPEVVLVVHGTVEASLAGQVAQSLEQDGARVAVVNVRLCKPFIEQSFLELLPPSVTSVGVLGQVHDALEVVDPNVRSKLYSDITISIATSGKWVRTPSVVDLKYPRKQRWTPISMAAMFQRIVKKPLLQSSLGDEGNAEPQLQNLISPKDVQQYILWDLDGSPTFHTSTILGQALSKDSTSNVTVIIHHDNLTNGGVFRTDIRKSKKTLDTPFSVAAADVVVLTDLALLNNFDVINSLRPKGKVLLLLPGVKDHDLEGKLEPNFRKKLSLSKGELYVLDPEAIQSVKEDAGLQIYLLQVAFLRVAVPQSEKIGLQKLAAINGNANLFNEYAEKLSDALRKIDIPQDWSSIELEDSLALPSGIKTTSFNSFNTVESGPLPCLRDWQTVAKGLAFKEAFGTSTDLRPDITSKTYKVHVKENRRLTPVKYDRNIFHIEFDLGDSGLKYDIGEALGIHAENDEQEVENFIKFYGLNPDEVVEVPTRTDPGVLENRTVYQSLMQNIDIFGRPPKRFYEELAELADDQNERKELQTLGGPEGANEFKRRAEVDTITYADILLEFPSAHPSFHDIVRLVAPMKRREYSIASCQAVTPNSVALMIVTVSWVDPKGRDRFGQATRYLNKLRPGAAATVSIKPSVMKLPPSSKQPLIMAGLGTGLAPFRAFVQYKAMEKAQGKEIGSVLLYMGSRHQREEYCYGEEWEAYQDAGVITLLGRAFSRDQPQKIYIQDRMRQTLGDIQQAYLKEEGAFYLCGPTWPVPDVTNVLEEAITQEAKASGRKVDPRKEIDRLKDELRYVLEVY